MIQKSIKRKLVVLIGLIILAISTGMGAIFYINAYNALVSNIGKTFPQIATQAANTVQASLDEHINELKIISSMDEIKNGSDINNKLSVLKAQNNANGSIKMGYADVNGIITYTDGTKANIKDKVYFKEALAGKSYVDDPVVAADKKSMSMVYAVPIKNNNSITGVLVSVRDGLELSEMIKKISFGKTGSAYMINSKSVSIAYVDKSMPLNKYNSIEQAKKDPSLKGIADMQKKMIAGKTGLSKYFWGGKYSYGGFAPVKKEGWSIVVILNENELLSELSGLKKSIAMYSILFLIGGILVTYFIADKISKKIKYSEEVLNVLATGDFSKDIRGKYLESKDEIGNMVNSMSLMKNSISSIIKAFRNTSDKIENNSQNLSNISENMKSSSNNVSIAIQEVANGAGNQANDLVEITNSLNVFSDGLEGIVSNLKDINTETLTMNELANGSSSNMDSLIEAVKNISFSFENLQDKIINFNSSIKDVSNIVNIINSIADETNLLALNASIEAARAGESGKSFAVVANEIRKLAEQTKVSSHNITDLIASLSKNTKLIMSNTDNMKNDLDSQVDVINNTMDSFKSIIEVIKNVMPKIQSVNSASENIKEEKDSIVEKVEDASSAAEEISASAEEITASSDEMSNLAKEVSVASKELNLMTKEMGLQIGKFKTQ
ncbi:MULTISPECIES: methyl-accepting chemotaxis protein [Clostridium]|uniref:methyl-accepting chemotaxis protein n=1 Tax=Clostridium TaxID=1485 RepID=UPI000824F1F5|nr:MULTISPECIES: methyl-accepting chemotaxis protein [Clostridium]PJI07395.1 methyl-accepting chemotaxis protein [Clostridium sp. CT7]